MHTHVDNPVTRAGNGCGQPVDNPVGSRLRPATRRRNAEDGIVVRRWRKATRTDAGRDQWLVPAEKVILL